MDFTTPTILVALITGLTLTTGFHVIYKRCAHERGFVTLAPWLRKAIDTLRTPQMAITALGCLLITVGYLTGWLTAETGVLLGNTFATPSWVMRKMARRLTNNCVFTGTVMRDYDDQYKQRGVKKGDTITLRLPQRYQVTVGKIMNPTVLTDQTVALSITDQTNIGFEYDSWSATLYVDDYMERYGNSAVDQLINNIDYTGLDRMYKATAKVVGTPGTVPTANATYTLAKTKLVEAAVPRPYNAVLTADMHGQIAATNQASFNPSAQISAFFREGQFSGKALGIDRWFEDENCPTHTVGALGGTPLVNGAVSSGSSVVLDGASNSITNWIREGDVVQFGTVEDINPLSHQSTNRNKDWVVTADADSSGAGAVTILVSPAIIPSGAFQNCDNGPADGDIVTIFGSATAYAAATTRQGLVYHKEAYACVMADLVLPKGLWVAERISNAKLGISIRMLKDHDVLSDESPARLDTAHGWGAIRQELACRVCS